LYYFVALAVVRGVAVTLRTDFFRRSEKSFQKIKIGLAMKIDEYVPTMIPTTSANENPLNTCPPNKKSDKAVNNVNPDVRTVRLSV
jgi:hypothetical protein